MQPPEYHKKLSSQLQEVFGSHSSNIPENLRPLLDQISASYQAYDDDYQRVVAMVSLRTDQLIASTSRAYSFLDSLHMGLIMSDINAEVVLTNKPAKEMLVPSGQSIDSIAWDLDHITELLQPDIDLKKVIKDSLATNQPAGRREVSAGAHILRIFIAPMINQLQNGETQQIGAVVLVEDITEQKTLERSKDEFLSIASHELRTPLTAIRGNTALIQKHYTNKITSSDVTDMITDIHESAVRLINIVNDFLDVSSLEQGKMAMDPTEFSLSDVIHNIAKETQNLCATKGISLVVDPSVDSTPPVLADEQRIQQVVYNLVGNALKFTDSGTITIHCRMDDNFVYTSVTDTGRGMSPESQNLLFHKFQQAGSSLLTRDTTKGTGLGLYISKLIIQRSGGQIGLEKSEEHKGSTFTFSLPKKT
jgi:signal transduction histidine kinase